MRVFVLSLLLVCITANIDVNGQRIRRDVSEVAKDYLPPTEKTPSNDYLPPSEEASTETAALGENGYEYRTVRRLKYRHRRDISETDISPEYLPPAAEEATTEAAVEEPKDDSAVLGANGYEYKTVRRLRFRHRRDVSEISPEYLPPAEESVTEAAAPAEEAEASDSAVLGKNGYEYKTVRRLRYRHRRDVSEISPEYLPPAEEIVTEAAAPAEEAEASDSAVLGKNGYEYKTVRRYKLRHRRDVSELSAKYLPPSEEATTTEAATTTVAPVPEEPAVKSNDGYHYDVPETKLVAEPQPQAQPQAQSQQYLPPKDDTVVVEGPKESAVLKADGYHYRRVYRY